MSNVFELNRQIYQNVSKADGTITTEKVNSTVGNTAAPGPVGTIHATTTVAAAATPQPSEEELLAIVAPNLYSYHVKYDDDVESSEKPQQIFMAYNGVFVRRTEKFNDNVISIISESKKVPGLRSMKEGILVDLKNKLPYSIFEELVANYRTIYRRDKTESSAQIYRLKELDDKWPGKQVGDYVVYYPKQKNSGANTNYSEDPDAIINLRQKHTLVMESHAHANFSAFFSGGDDNNEKAPLAYCVIGHVDSPTVSFAGRVKLMGLEKRMELAELFDVPADKLTPLSVDTMNLPEPSPMMLENAKSATTYVKTQAEIAEERMKQGLIVPGHQYGSTHTGTGYQRTNYGSHYSGYGGYSGYGCYSGYTKNDNYDNYRAKHNTKSTNKKTKALKKLDVAWIADNIDENRALLLLELLTERINQRGKLEIEKERV